jgi:hypothetical protein
MTAVEFRESVRRDAIKAGYTPEAADWLADAVTNPPSREALDSMPWCLRRLHLVEAYGSQRREPRDTLARMCAMYGPRAEELVPDFRASGLTLRQVAAVLTEVTGSAHHMSADASGAARMRLIAAKHWSH